MRMVYRRGGQPGQIDCPGNDYRVVEDVDQALAEGWSVTPVSADAAIDLAPAKKPASKK